MTLGEEAAAGRKCAALCITRQAQSGWQYRGKACKRSRQHVQQAVLTSPGLMSPRRTASSSASGMDAALVLPYCDRLLTTRSAAQHSVAQHMSVASMRAQGACMYALRIAAMKGGPPARQACASCPQDAAECTPGGTPRRSAAALMIRMLACQGRGEQREDQHEGDQQAHSHAEGNC